MKTALERGIGAIDGRTLYHSIVEPDGRVIYVAWLDPGGAKRILRETVAEAVKEKMQELYEFVASSDRTIAPTCLGEEILDEIAKYLTSPATEERG